MQALTPSLLTIRALSTFAPLASLSLSCGSARHKIGGVPSNL